MKLFLDSSAAAKRYMEEEGRARLLELLDAAQALAVSALAWSEVLSALCRRVRERRITAAQYAASKRELAVDLNDCSVLALSPEILEQAAELLEHWPLRSADALQLASALVWQAGFFASADRRQCHAARGAGLTVEYLA